MQISVWFEQVQWYQDNIQLDLSDRRSMSTVGSKHILSIRGVRSDNFGNYSCVADNTLGRAKKYMELSGECAPSLFNNLRDASGNRILTLLITRRFLGPFSRASFPSLLFLQTSGTASASAKHAVFRKVPFPASTGSQE